MLNGSPTSVIRLLRTGIVPSSAVESLSVGYSRFRADLVSGIEGFTSGSHQEPIFVNGEWGAGKSHALAYCRNMCSSRGIPTAHVSLNARTTPLNYPQRIYGEVAACVGFGTELGLRPLLHSLLSEPSTRSLLTKQAVGSVANPLSSSIRALAILYERGEGISPIADGLWSYLLGEDLGWANYPYKRDQALERINGLAEFFRAVNGGGLVLLMDEVETVDQLWSYRSRTVAYSVMTRIARMHAVWSMFAVTQRFTRLVALDGPRLGETTTSHDARSLLNSFADRTALVFDTPQLDRQRAMRLACAVAQLYHDAYPIC